MTYTNRFLAVNATDGDITDLIVTHTCGKENDPLIGGTVAPGDATTHAIAHSHDGSGDDWQIQFNGSVKRNVTKKCDLPNKSSLTCVIILYDDSFSIVTPDASPCLNNSY